MLIHSYRQLPPPEVSGLRSPTPGVEYDAIFRATLQSEQGGVQKQARFSELRKQLTSVYHKHELLGKLLMHPGNRDRTSLPLHSVEGVS